MLAAAMLRLLPFQGLTRPTLLQMVDAMRLCYYDTGAVVAVQGAEQPAPAFVVAEAGSFAVLRDDQLIDHLQPGQHAEELALLADEHEDPAAGGASCTLVAAANGSALWMLTRGMYNHVLAVRAVERQRRQQALMEHLPILQHANPEVTEQLLDSVETLHYADGDAIERAWSSARHFYLVEDGFVRVAVRAQQGFTAANSGTSSMHGAHRHLHTPVSVSSSLSPSPATSMPTSPTYTRTMGGFGGGSHSHSHSLCPTPESADPRADLDRQETDMAVLGAGTCFGALTPQPSARMEAAIYACGAATCAVIAAEVFEHVLGPCYAQLTTDSLNIERTLRELGGSGSGGSGGGHLSLANLTL